MINLSDVVKYWFNNDKNEMKKAFLSLKNVHLSMNERYLKTNHKIRESFEKWKMKFKPSNLNEIISLFKVLSMLKINKIDQLEMDKFNGSSSIDFIVNEKIKLEITSAVFDLNKKTYKEFMLGYLCNQKNSIIFNYEKLIWDLQNKIINILDKKINKKYIDENTSIVIWHTPFPNDVPFPGYTILFLILHNKLEYFSSILKKIDGIYFLTYYNHNSHFKKYKTQDEIIFNIPKLSNWQYADIIIKITKNDLPLHVETIDGWLARMFNRFFFLNIETI